MPHTRYLSFKNNAFSWNSNFLKEGKRCETLICTARLRPCGDSGTIMLNDASQQDYKVQHIPSRGTWTLQDEISTILLTASSPNPFRYDFIVSDPFSGQTVVVRKNSFLKGVFTVSLGRDFRTSLIPKNALVADFVFEAVGGRIKCTQYTGDLTDLGLCFIFFIILGIRRSEEKAYNC